MRSVMVAALTGLLMSAGRSAASQGTPVSPLDSLVQRARRDSNDAVVHYQLAMAYWDRKKWDDAERALREALVVAPSYPEAHLALGVLPEHRGEGYWKDRVKRDGEDKVRMELTVSFAHYRRAFLLNPLVDLNVLGKFEDRSTGIYQIGGRKVLVLAPWWGRELTRSANELRLGRYWEAFQRLDQLAQDPRFGGSRDGAPSDVLWFHGLAAGHLARFDDAVRDFGILTGRAIALESDTTATGGTVPLQSNDYRFILATMLYLSGRYDQAIPTFRRSLEFDLGLYVAHVQLARMHETLGELEDAIRERRRALDVQPDDPDLLIDLAGTLLKAGRTGEAREPLAEAARVNPRDARVPYLQGLVADALRDSAGALDAYARFLAIAPSRYAAQRQEVTQRLGRRDAP
jgi:tetratricopeptide (TPR) repeat protein